MKAVQLISHGVPGQFQISELPDPQPGPEEVILEVKACGLNHLDLWCEAGALPIPLRLPLTPGCEIAGRITALGADVDEWRVGERVAVQSNLFCGECEFCLRGDESLCLNSQLIGVQRDGGFAERVIVPWRALVRLPEDVSFEASAALTLAGSTAMHMLTDRAEVHPGEWVLVVGGASGVGSVAIQIAKGLGARVASTGSTEVKRELAKSLGADFVLDSNLANWPAEVRRITEKRGIDLIIEHSGGQVLERAFDCLARGGTIVTCGATSGREVTLNLWPFFVKQHRLIGSYGRNRSDMAAVLDWAAKGKLKPVIDRTYPLAETVRAFAQLRDRNVLGKLLIVP
ncbi:MAG: zinc-binding dehydrogenase [Candidatus Omnitrophica bacterium]|nr:zinc-binding dehydrogenase [Candidatus Omnitrophota bacterium]